MIIVERDLTSGPHMFTHTHPYYTNMYAGTHYTYTL